MTYRRLLEQLQGLTPRQLDHHVVIERLNEKPPRPTFELAGTGLTTFEDYKELDMEYNQFYLQLYFLYPPEKKKENEPF